MSGSGRPELVIPDARGLKLGVVASIWHDEICEQLLSAHYPWPRNPGPRSASPA